MKSLFRYWFIALAGAVLMSASCSSGSGGGSSTGNGSGGDGGGEISVPTNEITLQAHLSESSFEAALAGTDLEALVGEVKADGYSSFLGAGRVELPGALPPGLAPVDADLAGDRVAAQYGLQERPRVDGPGALLRQVGETGQVLEPRLGPESIAQ